MILILLIVLASIPNILGLSIVEAARQFPLFDVVIGVYEHQTLGSLLVNKGITIILLELLEFVAISIIIEFLQGLWYKRWFDDDSTVLNKIISIPIKFLMSVLISLCIMLLFCFAKTRLGQFGVWFSVAYVVIIAGFFLGHIFRSNGKTAFVSDAIIPLLCAIVDMLGLYFVCEGICRSFEGADSKTVLTIGIVTMAFVRCIKLLKNIVGF